MSRPTGTPGTFRFGCETVAAILDRDGTYWWQGQDTGDYFRAGYYLAVLIERRFVADDVSEWVTACEHEPVCPDEAECDRQATADDRQARAEADR